MELSLAEKRLLAARPDATPAEALLGDHFRETVEVLRAASGPERHGLLTIDATQESLYALTPEGLQMQERGLPERRAVQALEAAGGSFPMGELATQAGLAGDEVKVAIGWLKRKGWANIDKGQLQLADGVPDLGPDEELLHHLSAAESQAEGAEVLVQRGLATETTQTHRRITLTAEGAELAGTIDLDANAIEVNQITPEFVTAWAEMDDDARAAVHLRGFDFDVDVAARPVAKPHPLTQLMTQTRDIFWRMGFQEISGDYVESAFWNMDALFIPQDHPAREMQDTFYLEEPATLPVDEDDLARGKAIHEHGGETQSTGWQTDFSTDVAKQALLRTHTTNTTVRYLADNPTGIHKVFGLGKVFRKETMDATHLPEFYQIEGIVTEPGATFDMLVGLCRTFFTAMGFPEVRFRPAYFPYTEPSMEIDVKYRGKWMELGGCGVFRPEVTEPLGVEHPVLAWGFGLERLAMMRLGLKDIRDLYISDVKWLREQPLL